MNNGLTEFEKLLRAHVSAYQRETARRIEARLLKDFAKFKKPEFARWSKQDVIDSVIHAATFHTIHRGPDKDEGDEF